MLESFIYALAYTNIGTLMIPVGIGLARWRLLTVPLRFAWGGLLSHLLFFLLSLLILKLRLGSTLFIEYLLSGSVGGLFAVCFALAVPAGGRRWIIAGLGTLGLAGLLVEAVGQNRLMQTSLWSVPLETVISTIIILLYLHYLIRTTTVSLLIVPLFWLSIGRLAGALISTVYDALHAQILDSSRELALQWMAFQLLVSIGCNVLFCVGFWKVRTTRPSTRPLQAQLGSTGVVYVNYGSSSRPDTETKNTSTNSD